MDMGEADLIFKAYLSDRHTVPYHPSDIYGADVTQRGRMAGFYACVETAAQRVFLSSE